MNEKTGDKLGFWSIVLLAINAIIGSGIFLTPGSVVQQAGSKALVVYLIAGNFRSDSGHFVCGSFIVCH